MYWVLEKISLTRFIKNVFINKIQYITYTTLQPEMPKNTFFPTLTAGLFQGEESNEPIEYKIKQIKKRVEQVKQQKMEQLSQK